MENKDLKDIYNSVYEEGKESFHTFSLELIYSEVYKTLKNHINNKKILDLGCGDGSFLMNYVTLEEPMEIHGVDFSEVGIEKAKKEKISKLRNIDFRTISFEDLIIELEEDISLDKNYYDAIVSIGVMEHMDNPKELFYLSSNFLKSGGYFILETPNFLNTRGIIWKTLQVFVDAEMSKTDKHILLPNIILEYMEEFDFICEKIYTFDHDKGSHERMLQDFYKRLKPALRGKVKDLDMKLTEFFKFLKFVANDRVFPASIASGAEIIYKFRKK